MKILIAPDKFRGSLTANEVIEAVTKGIKRVIPDAEIFKQPMADGGEQTAEILAQSTNGKMVKIQASDPLFRSVQSNIGLSGDAETAFIEMAQASGLNLLQKNEYNPLKTSTFGTGELIKAALDLGVKRIVICIGGSATNDMGIGMAAALGFRFLDAQGQPLQPIGENLIKIQAIDASNVDQRIVQTRFEIACDVKNPLYGLTGAAHIYAKQKGANNEMIAMLDAGLKHVASLIKRTQNVDVQQIVGAGAAGGLGAGCIVFLNGALKPGVELVIDSLNLKPLIASVDLVITGEGKMDVQTLSGKVVQGVAQMAASFKKPCVAFCGTLDLNFEQIQSCGLTAAFSVLNAPMTLEQAQTEASQLLENEVANVMKVYALCAK